jgi:integrase
MVITNDGKLIYSIHTGDKTQVINMVYEVSGDQIIFHDLRHTAATRMAGVYDRALNRRCIRFAR